MILNNKFIVRKTIKTGAKAFKDMRVGDIVTIACELSPRRGASGGNGHYAPVMTINGNTVYWTELCRLLDKGFSFEAAAEIPPAPTAKPAADYIDQDVFLPAT